MIKKLFGNYDDMPIVVDDLPIGSKYISRDTCEIWTLSGTGWELFCDTYYAISFGNYFNLYDTEGGFMTCFDKAEYGPLTDTEKRRLRVAGFCCYDDKIEPEKPVKQKWTAISFVEEYGLHILYVIVVIICLTLFSFAFFCDSSSVSLLK